MATLRQTTDGALEKDNVRVGKDEATGLLLITSGGGVVALDADDVALLQTLVMR